MSNVLKYRIKTLVYALINKGIPLHGNESYNPFFIVGSGRCGTTLLRRILCANEGIHIPPENWSLGLLIRNFEEYRWHNDWNTIVDMTVAAHCHSAQGWFEKFPLEFVNQAKQCTEDKQSISWLLDSIYYYHAKKTGVECNRWGDKTPLNVNNMDLILDVFPNAQFVHMLRDGVDVVNSYRNRDGNDVLGPAQRWLSAIDSVENFRKKYPHKLLEVQYEDLVKEPEVEAKKVCNFLGITFDERIFEIQKSSVTEDLEKHKHYKNALKPISDSNIGKGRRELSADEKKVLRKVINFKLENLGYSPL